LTVPNQRSIPWGVAGMVALVIAIEGCILRHWIDLTDPVSLSWRFSAQSAGSEVRDCQLLCLGDSLVKHGLVPSVIERTSGLKAANLSAARASTLLTYCLLRRALDSGAHPRALVINAKPAVLLGGPEFNARPWQEVLSFKDATLLLQITRNAPFLVSTLVGRLLPSLRARLEIQSAVMAAIHSETARVRSINPVLWRNWTVNQGANIASAARAFSGELSTEEERPFYADLFYVDPANAEAIERILDLAAERRIPLYWVLCPLPPALQSLRDQSGADALHERFLRSIVARHPRMVTVLDARRSGYPAAFFADATHLNCRGALGLSRTVAAAVATRESAHQAPSSRPGWILLDPPGEGTVEWADALEDIEESRRIVNPDLATRVSAR
jgi:hypothetical protein